MRIISGKYKGRRFNAPKNLPARPTTDMAKEALFNILNNTYYFDELSVLDLFAGIGSISLEFASRGAAQIVSVDNHAGCIRYINSVSKEFNANITTIKSDVFKFLERTSLKADIIFADPPYTFETKQFAAISKLIFDRELLNDGGLLIIEHSKHTDLSDVEHYSYSKKYGGSTFSFFQYPEGIA
ncbi:MAG: 16S rRNA (guanine(966)-N(2))-methyltransferase RsmD [Flavobacteriaceae bacterium]|nr:16S rRNA (guanine(966)-N(2))-methyltransferase RsmD [Flavobacteriaceae bacterium]